MLRYKRIILSALFFALLIGLLNTVIQRPVYRAHALLEIKPQGNTIVDFQNVEESNVPVWTLLGTQQNILVSDAVARGAIERLGMEDDPELNGRVQQRGITRGIRQIIARAKTAVQAIYVKDDYVVNDAESSEDALKSAESMAEQQRVWSLSSRLRVESVEDSLLLRVYYDSFDRMTAAKVANAIAEEYVEQNESRRFSATDGAKEYLESEIQKVREKLEESERALTAFARETEVVDVEDDDNVINSSLSELSSSLTQTQFLRIRAQAEFEKTKASDIVLLPAVQKSELVRQLKKEHAVLQAEFVKLSGIYKSDYPALQQLQSKINEIDAGIRREADKVAVTIKNEYEQLVDEENLLKTALVNLKSTLLDQKDRAVKYNILKREQETNKELYSGLLERMKELGIAGGMELDNVSIIDRAAIPAGAYHPRLSRSLAVATLFGLLFGIGLAMLLAYLDNSVDSVEKLERVAKVASLGMVPKIDDTELEEGQSIDLISYQNHSNEVSEAFRSVRTSLMFSSPLGAPRTVSVTSSIPSEGKSVTAANLALVLAQSEIRVLLVDADLRRSRVHAIFSIPSSPGLSEVLTNNVDPVPIRKTEISTLDILTAGRKPPNPAELLGSSRMDDFIASVSDHYDIILFDAPPVLGLADSVVLGTKVDGILLVVSAQQVSQDAVREATRRFRLVRAPIVGGVLNQVTADSGGYGYNGQYYYQYDDDRAKRSA